MQYSASRTLAGPLLKAFCRPQITGTEHVPASGGAIVASNHLSIVDSIYLPLMLARPVTFAAKSEYFTGTRLIDRFTRAYMRATKQLAVDRTGPRAAQDMLDGAEAGHVGQADPRGKLKYGRQADEEADLSAP